MPTTIPREEFRKHIRLEELFNEGRQLEFSDKSFKRAIEKYIQVADNRINERLAAEAGFAVGRCYSKMGEHAKAVQSYGKLFFVSPSLRVSEGLPVPLESRLAGVREQAAAGKGEEAVALLLETYTILLDYGYPLALEEFHGVTRRIQGQIDDIEKDEGSHLATVQSIQIFARWRSCAWYKTNTRR